MRRFMTNMATRMLAFWAIFGYATHGQEPEPRTAPPAAQGRADTPAQADRAKAKAADPARMDWLLKQWEKQSSLLKTLDVTILRIDNTPGVG